MAKKAQWILLTFQEWLAFREYSDPSRFGEPRISMEAFATSMPLNSALGVLADYVALYKRKYPNAALEFKLLSISTMPPGWTPTKEMAGLFDFGILRRSYNKELAAEVKEKESRGLEQS